MPINEVVEQAKAKAGYSRRRATAIKDHGKAVLNTGLDAAKQVAVVAVKNLKIAVATQKATLTDREVPILMRVRSLRPNAIEAAQTARKEIKAAIEDGISSTREKLSRVTTVTHREQAQERKLGRKAKKARTQRQRIAKA